uniref:DUF7695 domain-containing protein n=1 Tax=viral metagenome TaxID=1070528 RepID=A0A6H1ZHT7_9ZZZZ
MGKSRMVVCLNCNDTIQSTYRHDYVVCKCGAIFIDGGDSYCRLGYPAGKTIEESLKFLNEEDLDETKGG